jgi:hypothetical protein
MWDERDDTFPGIGTALDSGIVDTSVWWGDKDHIERSSLAEKRVAFLEEKMRELYPNQEHVKMKGCEPPSKDMGWNICTVDLEELKGGVNLTFEVRDGILKHTKGRGQILCEDPKRWPSPGKVRSCGLQTSLLTLTMTLMMRFGVK